MMGICLSNFSAATPATDADEYVIATRVILLRESMGTVGFFGECQSQDSKEYPKRTGESISK